MRFWTRELAGWILLVVGLYLFRQAFVLLTIQEPRLLEGATLTIIGVVVFRGGIHLLKVAVAAQVCLEAQEAVGNRPAGNRGVVPAGRGTTLPGRSA
jgi:hypothetical protein